MIQQFMNFDTFVFPKIAKIIYFIGIGLIALTTVIGFFASLFTGNFFPAIGALIGGVVGVIVWRVTVEIWLVLFSILDTLKQIRDKS